MHLMFGKRSGIHHHAHLAWIIAGLLGLVVTSGCGAQKAADRAMEDGAMAAAEAAADEVEEVEDVAPQITSASQAPMLVPPVSSLESYQMPTAPDSEEYGAELAAPRFERQSANRSAAAPALAPPAPFEQLPAGAAYSQADGFATVSVYYATDRAPDPIPLSAYSISGNKALVQLFGISTFGCFAITGFALIRRRNRLGAMTGLMTIGLFGVTVVALQRGVANIEKHGVTYTAERGATKLGLAMVTVPASHERGQVERPSLLRFEFAEDQQKHIVMTSATELSDDDFYRRLENTVATSPDRDLLVFIHGYNVDFESAIQRTAQLAVDLPFRGVPVCYSWPSQGTLLGYTVDENNAAWTASHLRDFLLDLAERSHADAINVVAHSMGNRALTTALSEISFTLPDEQPAMFHHVVLAAPDVDADYFRKDLAPRILRTAERVTLYASSDDRALVASKQVHGYPRAGESGADIVVVPGVDTIDVSGIDLSLLGHSSSGDSGVILRDLFEMLQHGLPAQQRGQLIPQQLSELIYYRLVPNSMAGTAIPQVR